MTISQRLRYQLTGDDSTSISGSLWANRADPLYFLAMVLVDTGALAVSAVAWALRLRRGLDWHHCRGSAAFHDARRARERAVIIGECEGIWERVLP